MNLSLQLPKKLKGFNWKEMMPVWYRHYKLIFLILFLAILGLAGYEWYYSLHRYVWTEDRKRAHIDAHFEETSFKEKEFHNLTGKLRQRAQEHSSQAETKRNIFTGAIQGN